jgi:hypothetical protein
VPAAFANANAASTSSFPFTYTNYVRLQQVIMPATMGMPRIIEGCSFRPRTWGTAQQQPFTVNLEVRISLSANPPGSLDGTYANNVKGPQTLVYKGPVYFATPTGNAPAEFSATVWFTTPFVYTGTDPLLLDLVPTDACAGGGDSRGCDYDATDAGMSTVLGKNPAGCGMPVTGGFESKGGFVIKFFGAALMQYGLGCKGSNGVPEIGHTGGGPARGNTAFAVTVAQAAASSVGILLVGASRDTYAGPLPQDLTGLGMPGCWLWTSILLIGSSPTNAAGSGSVSLPIPNDAALANVAVFSQWVVADPGVNPLGASASNGGIIAIR